MDAEEGIKVQPDEDEEVAETSEPVAQSENDFMAGAMMANGIVYSDVPKFIKDSGLKFRRKAGSTWKDLSVEAFKENVDLTKEEMLEAIRDSVKDPEYYVKGYYKIFKELAKI